MKSLQVVTSARADYGIYLPILRQLQRESGLSTSLLVTGMHLSQKFGNTVAAIESDGFEIGARIPILSCGDSAADIATAIGNGVRGFSEAYARSRPDLLLVLGDRFEMFSAVAAATPFNIPIAHIHGGELTEGAMDDAFRHAITKMSHLHFVSTPTYRDRVVQLGEEPWRVHISGAPSLDNLRTMPLLSLDEVRSKFGLRLPQPFLIATWHPVTRDTEDPQEKLRRFLAALETVDKPVVVTYPNADPGGLQLIAGIEAFATGHPKVETVANLGTQAYFSLMAHAAAMVGNSSSGIIEAASFKLPVVNVGNRQAGRIHGANVIDTEDSTASIVDGIRRATSIEFRISLEGLVNPYGNGHASETIVETLRNVDAGPSLLHKRFHDVALAR